MKRKRGLYIIGNGLDLHVKQPANGVGYDLQLDPERWYVVHGMTGKVMGSYPTEELAINLILFLDKRDKEILSDEMERILVSDERPDNLGE